MTGPIQFQAYAPTITLERETRTIRGAITAYGVPTTDYRRIVIHEGALRPRMPLSRVKMLIDHDQRQPVGYMTELDSDARVAAFKIPEGDEGDKALTDAANGLRDGLSIGINVIDEDGAFTYDAEHGTYHVYAAELVEVSLCAIPAYQDAGVTSVAATRHTNPPKENTPMPDTTLTLEEVEETLARSVEEIDRRTEARLAAFTPEGAGTGGPTFQSFGAFVQAVAAGDSEALAFAERLAYEGPTSEDAHNRNVWVADAIRLVEKQRRILNTFTREPLPAEGMTLEYAKISANTLKVQKQATEGADLPTGKISLDSASTSVDTYGGYTEAPIQVIKRANSGYLTTMFKAMGLEYARATEAAVRTKLKEVISAQRTANKTVTLAAAQEAYDWLDLIVDAAERYDDLGYTLEGTLVSKDVFKRLLRLEDTAGNSLMRVSGEGINRVGTIDVPGLTGDLASVKFKLFPSAAANTAVFYDPIGFTTWESAGAPFQLQDTNVINLTEAFSLYGFMANASQFPDAITPVVFSTAG